MRTARATAAVFLELTATGLTALARKIRPARPWIPLVPDQRFYQGDGR